MAASPTWPPSGPRSTTPLLRKDFVVTDYQLWEGRAAGADLALLIVAALTQAELTGFLELGDQLGITCLVETHTTEEVRRALDAGARLVGVNNRNLKTLEVDLSHFEEMAETIGDTAVKVAESGILSVDDAVRMRSRRCRRRAGGGVAGPPRRSAGSGDRAAVGGMTPGT